MWAVGGGVPAGAGQVVVEGPGAGWSGPDTDGVVVRDVSGARDVRGWKINDGWIACCLCQRLNDSLTDG